MKEIFTLEKIEKIAKNVLAEVRKNNKDKATIIAFDGDLGAGKTTLTKEISKQLGVVENVISPTFVIMKIYKTKDQKFKNLIHIDAYRLNKSEELFSLGWKELVKNKDNFIIVEWPEKVPECLENDVFRLKLEHKDAVTRSIVFNV